MNVLVFSYNLRVAGGLSVGRNIVRCLPEVAPRHRYLMLVPSGCGYSDFSDKTKLAIYEVPLMPLWKRIIWEFVTLRRLISKFQPDWIWALGNYGLVFPPCRQSILVHDPHLVYPETTYLFESLKYRLLKRVLRYRLRLSLRNSERCYCQTTAMADRLSSLMRYPRHRISICPNSVSRDVIDTNETENPETLRPYKNRFKLFALTKFYGHKNIQAIVEMYSRYRRELSNTLCILTISRDQHPMAHSVIDRIHDESLEDLIINVGPLSQTELSAYYRNVNAILLPSFLESFSVTYLEAMALGCPIITSDLDFAHSVCGDAACYVDPYRPESIRDGILRMAGSAEYRCDLVKKGYRQVALVSRTWRDLLREVCIQEGLV